MAATKSNADAEAEWIALAEQAREQLSQLVPFIPAMKPEEVKTVVDTMQALMDFDRFARCFEKEIDLKQARVVYDD